MFNGIKSSLVFISSSTEQTLPVQIAGHGRELNLIFVWIIVRCSFVFIQRKETERKGTELKQIFQIRF